MFPIITKIDHVLPFIKDMKEFIVAEREYFDVINYVVMTPDTFPPLHVSGANILRECRGLIFDKSGELLSRPLHKFFNLNEREETLVKNISFEDCETYEKLDGSMIRPVWIKELNKFWWCTKMGMSDTAVNADQYANSKSNYIGFAEMCTTMGVTPTFEWCSNKNRIVISHPEDKLVLIAIRENFNGNYFLYNKIVEMAQAFDIPVVQKININPDSLISKVKGMTGIEGFIFTFPNGNRVKIKTDEYLHIHKAKDIVSSNKNMLQLIVENQLDDIKPSLLAEDLKIVEDFEAFISDKIQKKVDYIDAQYQVYLNKYNDRREFAINTDVDNITKSMVFSKIDGKDSMEIVLTLIRKNVSTETKYENLMRNILVE